jgi:hypothetical protein
MAGIISTRYGRIPISISVGIDCYFPLTPDVPQSQIDYQAVYDGWTKDEGWDYYYLDSVNRTGKTFYGSATYAWKNVKNWWNSTHTNPNATGTAWTAKMKPVWFTEVGFPSVDGCANQPNVFIDPDSIGELLSARFARGAWIFSRSARRSMPRIDYLKAQNTLEANFLPRRFVWTWDARPFPFWPDLAQYGQMAATGKQAIGFKASWGFQTSARSSPIC